MKKARYTSPPGSRAVRSRPAVAPRWAAVPESGPNPRVASLPVRRWSRTCSGNVRRRRGRSSSAGAEPRERGGPVAVPVERWWSEERRLHALFLLVVQPYARQSAVVECLSPSDVLGALPWLERSRRLTEDPYNRNKGGGGGGGGGGEGKRNNEVTVIVGCRWFFSNLPAFSTSVAGWRITRQVYCAKRSPEGVFIEQTK